MTTEQRKADCCPVCGGDKPHYFGKDDLCRDCEKQKAHMEELKRQRLRDKAFGSPWDFAKGEKP